MIGRTNAGFGGGGGLNLRVYGGTSAPASPKENDIWVKTNLAIPGWALLDQKITLAMKTGYIYLTGDFTDANNYKNTTGVILNTNGNPGGTIYARLVRCIQYDGSAWKNVDAYVYHSGWNQFSSTADGILIADGVPYTTPSTTGKVVQQDGYLQYGSGANKSTAMWFDDIDLTGYSTITLIGTFTHYSGQQYDKFVLAAWYGSVDPASGNAAAAVSYATKTTVTLDVSNLTGKHKVGLTSNNTYTQKITSLVLT